MFKSLFGKSRDRDSGDKFGAYAHNMSPWVLNQAGGQRSDHRTDADSGQQRGQDKSRHHHKQEHSHHRERQSTRRDRDTYSTADRIPASSSAHKQRFLYFMGSGQQGGHQDPYNQALRSRDHFSQGLAGSSEHHGQGHGLGQGHRGSDAAFQGGEGRPQTRMSRTKVEKTMERLDRNIAMDKGREDGRSQTMVVRSNTRKMRKMMDQYFEKVDKEIGGDAAGYEGASIKFPRPTRHKHAKQPHYFDMRRDIALRKAVEAERDSAGKKAAEAERDSAGKKAAEAERDSARKKAASTKDPPGNPHKNSEQPLYLSASFDTSKENKDSYKEIVDSVKHIWSSGSRVSGSGGSFGGSDSRGSGWGGSFGGSGSRGSGWGRSTWNDNGWLDG